MGKAIGVGNGSSMNKLTQLPLLTLTSGRMRYCWWSVGRGQDRGCGGRSAVGVCGSYFNHNPHHIMLGGQSGANCHRRCTWCAVTDAPWDPGPLWRMMGENGGLGELEKMLVPQGFPLSVLTRPVAWVAIGLNPSPIIFPLHTRGFRGKMALPG